MNSSVLNVAICGVGPRGLEHAAAIQKTSGLRLTGLFDISAAAREQASRITGCRSFQRLDELLRECRPDLVVIATPPRVRLSLVEQIVHWGHLRALVIEKPLALSVRDAKRISALCAERAINVRVCHQLRFSPEFVLLRDAVRSGQIGQVRSMQAFCYGNLLSQGIHMIDMLRWLLDDQRVASVEAYAVDDLPQLARVASIPPEFAEDLNHPAPLWTQATICFSGGIQSTLNSGLLAPVVEPALGNWLQKRVSVLGTDGFAEAHVASHFRLLHTSGREAVVQRTGMETYRASTQAFYGQLVDDVQADVSCLASFEESVHSVEVLLACLESVVKGCVVSPPLAPESDPLASWIETKNKVPKLRQASSSPVDASKPKMTVILPMEDHRGLGSQAIESWVHHQRCDPDDFELIIITDARTREREAEFSSLLRPSDTLIHREAANEMDQYHIGAKLAKGQYLLFTEPHCVAEPQAISEAIRFFETRDLDGFCPRSVPLLTNDISRMESRMYEDGFIGWSRAERWEKVILRGFAIRSQIYFEVGGFNPRYGRFAEWLLAATLKQKGYRLAYAPGFGVNHLYADNFSLLDAFIKEFTDGECLFRDEGPRDFCLQFFGQPPEWDEVRSIDPVLIRLLVQTLWNRVLRGPVPLGAGRSWWEALKQLLRLLPLALLGARLLVLKWENLVRGAVFRFYWWWMNSEKRYQAFVDWYSRTTSLHRVRYAVAHPVRPPSLPVSADSYLAEEISPGNSFGFHALETHEGQSFRWSSAVAALQLSLPRGDYRVIVQTLGVRVFEPSREISVYIDGYGLAPVRFDASTFQLQFDLPARFLPDSARHWLIFHCTPWRADNVHLTDSRQLGIPLVSVRAEVTS
jgi:predicted dehydrogenase